jgi:hypothetical protein
MIAIKKGNIDLVKTLIDKCNDINEMDIERKTPLMTGTVLIMFFEIILFTILFFKQHLMKTITRYFNFF